MTETTQPLPVPGRPDEQLIQLATWQVVIPDQQQAIADLTAAAFPAPDGLLAAGCLLGVDGVTLLMHLQWADRNAAREFAATTQYAWHNTVDAAISGAGGVERRPLREYHLHRGRHFTADPPPTGCVVLVDRHLPRPDPARAREWIDTMFALPEPDEPAPGMISAHFYVSSGGSRVVNYAHWTTVEAHRAISVSSVEELTAKLGENPEWRAVETSPGITFDGFRRYLPYRSLTTGSGTKPPAGL